MKAKYLIMFLILALIFSSVGCVKPEPETIKVQYVVVAYIDISWIYPTVTVSYNNHFQGKTDTYNLILRRSTNEVFRDLKEPISFYPEVKNWHGEIIATYNHVPKNEPLAIAAINTNKIDALGVFIIVNDLIWKEDFIPLCTGEDCAADASGYYDK